MYWRFGKKTLVLMATIALAAGLVGGRCAAQDEVVLRNGDRLTGVVVERSDSLITLEHRAWGRLEIPVEDVLRLSVGAELVMGQRPPHSEAAAPADPTAAAPAEPAIIAPTGD